MVQLKRLIVFLDALTKFLNGWVQEQRDANDVKSPGKSEVLTPGVLLGRLGPRAAAINLLEVDEYLRKSKVSKPLTWIPESSDTSVVDFPENIWLLRKTINRGLVKDRLTDI